MIYKVCTFQVVGNGISEPSTVSICLLQPRLCLRSCLGKKMSPGDSLLPATMPSMSIWTNFGSFLVGGWTNPSETYAHQIGSSWNPKDSGWIFLNKCHHLPGNVRLPPQMPPFTWKNRPYSGMTNDHSPYGRNKGPAFSGRVALRGYS